MNVFVILMTYEFLKKHFLKFSSKKLLSITHYEGYLSIIKHFSCIYHRNMPTICLFCSKFFELLISRISDNVFCRTILKPEKGVLIKFLLKHWLSKSIPNGRFKNSIIYKINWEQIANVMSILPIWEMTWTFT